MKKFPWRIVGFYWYFSKMTTEVLLCVVVLLCAVYYYVIWHFFEYDRLKRHIDKIPGPYVWPVVGNLPALSASPQELWKLLLKWDKQYYPTYKIWTTHRTVVVILDPDDVETVLSSMRHIEKSIVYCPLHPWLKTGLLTSAGEKWQKRRKILTPAFHFNVLQQYVSNIVENGEKVVESIKKNGEVELDIVPILVDYTLNVICETAMGSSLEDKHDSNYRKKYRSAIHDMGNIVIFRLMNPWFQVNWTFRWTSWGRLQKRCLNVLHSFTKKIVDERKKYHEKTNGQFLKLFSSYESSNEPAEQEYFGYRKKRLAMLDLLIAAQRDGGQIDDEGIREEVDTFMFEGHDTSAMALSFALLLIAEHREIQGRIRAEVNEVLADSGGKITMAEIQRFHYTELCVKESLRLYPSVPVITRAVNEDLQLKEYLVPKGTILGFSIFSIHRDPRFWKEPEKFDPERFLPERFHGHHPFSYIPFSAGPRNCIGQKFAMLELKAFIAHVVHNFYLEPIDLAHEIPLEPNLVIRPCCPMRVKFIPIKK